MTAVPCMSRSVHAGKKTDEHSRETGRKSIPAEWRLPDRPYAAAQQTLATAGHLRRAGQKGRPAGGELGQGSGVGGANFSAATAVGRRVAEKFVFFAQVTAQKSSGGVSPTENGQYTSPPQAFAAGSEAGKFAAEDDFQRFRSKSSLSSSRQRILSLSACIGRRYIASQRACGYAENTRSFVEHLVRARILTFCWRRAARFPSRRQFCFSHSNAPSGHAAAQLKASGTGMALCPAAGGDGEAPRVSGKILPRKTDRQNIIQVRNASGQTAYGQIYGDAIPRAAQAGRGVALSEPPGQTQNRGEHDSIGVPGQHVGAH